MDKHDKVSPDYLKSIFQIDGKGLLRRAVAVKTYKVGDAPGSVGTDGYVRVGVRGNIFYLHRVVWAVANGAWPRTEIDHINGDKQDNRVQNLRLATRQQNMQNIRTAPAYSKNGTLGVRYESRMKTNPWRAMGWLNGKNVSIGYFSDKETAHAAYLTWKREAHEFCTI